MRHFGLWRGEMYRNEGCWGCVVDLLRQNENKIRFSPKKIINRARPVSDISIIKAGR